MTVKGMPTAKRMRSTVRQRSWIWKYRRASRWSSFLEDGLWCLACSCLSWWWLWWPWLWWWWCLDGDEDDEEECEGPPPPPLLLLPEPTIALGGEWPGDGLLLRLLLPIMPVIDSGRSG